MQFSLIICTYMRPESLLKLLESVQKQTIYPNEIIIVDGSTNNETEYILTQNPIRNLHYFLVDNLDRGLTRQRNFGIKKVSTTSEIVCFLDDDTILENNYFEEILKTYKTHPNALGVGGYITNESQWQLIDKKYQRVISEFDYDGWKVKEGNRFVLRKLLGLDSDKPPGYSTNFSHGRSVGFLPPTGKTYPVELVMGGVSSFKKEILDQYKFSTYFEGYGLYEDADYSIRISKVGQLYVNTAARLEHHHAPSGRPNQYNYGKMVVRNGWYVWRVKNSDPSFVDKIKWHSITLLLIFLRFTNIFTTSKRKQAFTETAGRLIGWISLFYNKPQIINEINSRNT